MFTKLCSNGFNASQLAKSCFRAKTVVVDSTSLDTDPAMKSIVRRDSGEDWRNFLIGLMRAEGTIGADEKPTVEERRRFDKNRKGKRVSNEDWPPPN